MFFLLLDDHPIFRNSLRGLLEFLYPDACFSVCGSVADAEALLEEQTLDFVIADLELLDGVCFDLIRMMKHKYPSLPVLVLSMHEDSSMINPALEAGADGYVSKRESTTVVKEAIVDLLDGKKYFSQTISAALVKSIQEPEPPPKVDVTQILSKREYDVFKLLGSQCSRKQIADKLNIGIPPLIPILNA